MHRYCTNIAGILRYCTDTAQILQDTAQILQDTAQIQCVMSRFFHKNFKKFGFFLKNFKKVGYFLKYFNYFLEIFQYFKKKLSFFWKFLFFSRNLDFCLKIPKYFQIHILHKIDFFINHPNMNKGGTLLHGGEGMVKIYQKLIT